MIPPPFDYHSPKTLPEALELLGRLGEDAKILSGGQSLLPLLKLRLAQPAHLVDIGRIPGLDYINEEGGFLRIGALVRESALESSALVRSKYPILVDTASVVADPLVRNLATVCGNLAHGDPANDHPATMLALGAEVVLTGAKGSRTVPVAEFFTGLFATALRPTEVLSEIRIPVPPAGSGGAYVKLERKVGDFATAGAAAFLVSKGGTIERAGIGLTNLGPTPVKARDAEKALAGKRATEDAFAEAGRLAAAAASPSADRRGSVEYKREMARVLTVRALRLAARRAEGR
ncbi:MAG TPA: xanthine dehydrogenase family protein subunit M [Vicinamibacteria bacterium]|nr:xanthine dehydrogenase family protein subunit M [Vicinamibacteria bacterium]